MAIRLTHYNRTVTFAAKYAQSVGVTPALIYQLIDYSIRRIWKRIAPARPLDFRTSATLSDGSRLPADWIQYAGAASYVDGGAVKRPFHYIDPSEIGQEKVNTYGKATASNPAIYFEDGKVKTVPAGLTNILTHYFNRPPYMYGGNDNTDDGMPGWTAIVVEQDASQALREMSIDPAKAEETLIAKQRESLQANAKLISRFTRAANDDVQSTLS